jgi:hypothetical protein
LGIAEDFEGLRSRWSSLSSCTKLIFSASMVLSFLSIASLADHVYKLKGFMNEAVILWSSVTKFFVDVLAIFDLEVKPWQLDFWVIIILASSPYLFGRWHVLSLHRKFQHILMFFVNLSLPFIFTHTITIYVASFFYIAALCIIFWPPLSKDFAFIGIKMVLPPVSVAILAAIAEGISRPLI